MGNSESATLILAMLMMAFAAPAEQPAQGAHQAGAMSLQLLGTSSSLESPDSRQAGMIGLRIDTCEEPTPTAAPVRARTSLKSGQRPFESKWWCASDLAHRMVRLGSSRLIGMSD